MTIARRKHQTIELADILADEDQFTPELDPEVPSLDRMHINIDMPDSRYWSTHRPHALPGTCAGDPRSTAAYQEVTPFSTVSGGGRMISFPLQRSPSCDDNSQRNGGD